MGGWLVVLRRAGDAGGTVADRGVRLLAADGRARVVDCSDLDWIDVDDAPALAHAEAWRSVVA